MKPQMRRCQVVVIGGGLAGAACAIELGRAGAEAVAFDRDLFPRRKVCGELLSPGAVRCLDDLGVLGEVQSQGAVPIHQTRVRLAGRTLHIPFEKPGLGFSRERLDWILAEQAGVRRQHSIERVERMPNGFRVRGIRPSGRGFHLDCEVIIDAAGKLSRFTRRRVSPKFGVQYYEHRPTGSTLEFDFFDGGYGGSVSVEGGRTNTCFLVDRAQVRKYISRQDCIVTGPLGYRRIPGSYMAIGDAGGMIDPFCGEGMRQALESGRLAARMVAGGLRRGRSYGSIRRDYEREWSQRWARKRALASVFRWTLDHPMPKQFAFALAALFPYVGAGLLRQLWR